MNFEQLKYMIEVSDAGSFYLASKKLHITQSALSQSIKKIEEELNVQIFIRSRNGTSPTAIGEKIIDKAKCILNEKDELVQLAKSNPLNQIRIGTFQNPKRILSKSLVLFKRSYPHIEISILRKSMDEIIDELLSNQLEIGIINTIDYDREINKNIHIESVLNGDFLVGMGKNSKFISNAEIFSDEIVNYPLIVYEHPVISSFLNHLSRHHGKLNIIFQSNSIEAVRHAVEEGIGISIFPDYFYKSQSNLKSAKITPILIKGNVKKYDLSIAYLSSNHHIEVIEQFINYYKQLIEQQVIKFMQTSKKQ